MVGRFRSTVSSSDVPGQHEASLARDHGGRTGTARADCGSRARDERFPRVHPMVGHAISHFVRNDTGIAYRRKCKSETRHAMVEEWVNWSGSLRFAPGEVIAPGSEDELARVVERAAGSGGAIRVVGAGHSSSPLVATDDTLISLQHLCDIEIHDAACGEATIGAGVTLHEAGKALLTHGLAFANLGDIDTQTAIGAFATGTHGTGAALANLSAHLVGGRVVTSADFRWRVCDFHGRGGA
jgi:hypothetical protein